MAKNTPETQSRSKRAETCAIVQAEKAMEAKAVAAQIATEVVGRPGQPTKFTPEIWERILACVASYGDLFEECAKPDMPSVYTVQGWIRKDKKLMDDMRAAWEAFSMIGYSANNNILRGGVLSTGDKARDFEIAANNRWHMSKTNRRDFGDKVQVDVMDHKVFVVARDDQNF